MCQRQFFRKISQNQEYVERFVIIDIMVFILHVVNGFETINYSKNVETFSFITCKDS